MPPTNGTERFLSGPAFDEGIPSDAPDADPSAAAGPSESAGPVSRAFILAGRAIYTVSNPQGIRYTFKVSKVENDPTSRWYRADAPNTYFVSYLAGPDNTADYVYLGILNPRTYGIQLTKASRVQAASQVYRVAQWALNKIWTGDLVPKGYGIVHAGRCGRCGRLLTVPESIRTGFGPECAGKL